ncbi:MAG: FAD-binding oxidoreductase [Glaciimonas sp.]|nr:FAD-binding oxidoreductase [Glaciimonas sp.]
MTVPISSWGRLGTYAHHLVALNQTDKLPLSKAAKALPFGNGRSYGDVCLNPDGVLWTTLGLDKFIAFDDDSGVVTCETGVLLCDIQRLVVPRGWMLPVTPGTQLITVGGAIANDVHGKNHHVRGSFGDHVKTLRLLRTDGGVIDCGPDHQADWFAATVGGMGLTGVVSQATLQLRRIQGPWLETENVPFHALSEFFQLADSSEASWEHTVSWIDCLNGRGRGVFMRGNHVDVQDGPVPAVGGISVPLVPPISLVNKLSLRPFNLAYYQLQARKRAKALVHYEPFFHPLDNVRNWNRIYGPKGFYQYQSVVPREMGQAAVLAMLKEIARSGEGSFLAVLKTFGERKSVGMMSFPMPGVTLALDFPNKGEKTLALLRCLDDIVRDAGGRIYPAKDSCMPRDLFEAGYPNLAEFVKYRDPGISSAMSRRLMGN